MWFAGEVSEEVDLFPSAYDEEGYPDLFICILGAGFKFRRFLGFATCGFEGEV
jgi:hypothetical protein